MHLHILGICGTFMAGVAAIARGAGHRVTGSDRGVYPPMSDLLADLGIDVLEGYAADQLSLAPDVVLVGNVMTRGMPVVEALLNSDIPYTSGPAWLADNVLRGQRVVAVAGTHGKTTTTSLLAWILDKADENPGFLIGGVPCNFDCSARTGGGRVFVIEADEYDTAFFDKRAKFLLYRPEVVIINNLEFDHADIYADLQEIQRQFHQLIRALPGCGRLIVRADDAHIREVLDMGCWTPVDTFSSAGRGDADWAAQISPIGEFRFLQGQRELGACRWQLAGEHNAENALAALLAARHFGVSVDVALDGLATFEGVKRRLELRGVFGGVELYDDFAHHPTEIRRTIAGVKNGMASGRVLVVLEPRSNTMKMGVHRAELAAALADADYSWVYRPDDLEWDLEAALADLPSASVLGSVGGIVGAVARESRAGDKVIVMSNGGFENIHATIERALSGSAGPR
jgi:UDP-N-acetylmuramate: L-alanyl-gamma-D-glutamyl-meso-diaminopimelate ligase